MKPELLDIDQLQRDHRHMEAAEVQATYNVMAKILKIETGTVDVVVTQNLKMKLQQRKVLNLIKRMSKLQSSRLKILNGKKED